MSEYEFKPSDSMGHIGIHIEQTGEIARITQEGKVLLYWDAIEAAVASFDVSNPKLGEGGEWRGVAYLLLALRDGRAESIWGKSDERQA